MIPARLPPACSLLPLTMTQLRALIFDVDGTLAETERDGHRVAFNRAFAQVNLGWDWCVSLYQKLTEIGGGKERIRAYIQEYQPQFCPPANFDQWVANLHQLKTQHYRDLLASGLIPLRPGVQRLLQEAREQGIILAIATTSAFPNATALLEYTLGPDALSWFAVIAAGDIVPAKKPAPDIYLYVLEQLQLSPSECLVFEDSAPGLQAAIQAGLTTIVTVNDYTQDQDFTGAGFVVNHLGEPDNPLTTLAGDFQNCSYLDVKTLQDFHQQCLQSKHSQS